MSVFGEDPTTHPMRLTQTKTLLGLFHPPHVTQTGNDPPLCTIIYY
ncbi:hypothetical protein ACFLT2_10735 [Acidobacteriota bacterium]